MKTRSIEMRRILESLETPIQLDELLGSKTIKKAAAKGLAKAGVSSAKALVKQNEKVDKLTTQLQATFKNFTKGQVNHPEFRGKKQNPRDPNTIKTFLNLVGFDESDIIELTGDRLPPEPTNPPVGEPTPSDDEIEISASYDYGVRDQLLQEFMGIPGKAANTLKKAAEYAVVHGIRLGSGSAGQRGPTGSPNPGGQNNNQGDQNNTNEGDPGLDKLDPAIVAIMKRISPKTAEALDLKLLDGLDLKPSQLKPVVEADPNNAVSMLALVGYSYLHKKLGGLDQRRQNPPLGGGNGGNPPTPPQLDSDEVNIG